VLLLSAHSVNFGMLTSVFVNHKIFWWGCFASFACCTCMGPTAPSLCCPWFTSLERGLIQYYLRHHCCRRLTAGPALTTAIQHASSVFEFCDGHFVIKLRARCAKSIMLRLKTKTQPILHKIALLSSDVEGLAEACRRFLSDRSENHTFSYRCNRSS